MMPGPRGAVAVRADTLLYTSIKCKINSTIRLDYQFASAAAPNVSSNVTHGVLVVCSTLVVGFVTRKSRLCHTAGSLRQCNVVCSEGGEISSTDCGERISSSLLR